MKKIILLSVFMSLSVHSAGEEGTGNEPLNNTPNGEICMMQMNHYVEHTAQEYYAMCLSEHQ